MAAILRLAAEAARHVSRSLVVFPEKTAERTSSSKWLSAPGRHGPPSGPCCDVHRHAQGTGNVLFHHGMPARLVTARLTPWDRLRSVAAYHCPWLPVRVAAAGGPLRQPRSSRLIARSSWSPLPNKTASCPPPLRQWRWYDSLVARKALKVVSAPNTTNWKNDGPGLVALSGFTSCSYWIAAARKITYGSGRRPRGIAALPRQPFDGQLRL